MIRTNFKSPRKRHLETQGTVVLFEMNFMAFNIVSTQRAVEQKPVINLKKKHRPGEFVIQAFLFFAGALSIFTTIGIVYGLGKESVAFFTRQLWENTNKPLVIPVGPTDTTLEVGTSGQTINPEDIIRISDEIMLVTAVNGTFLIVERGYQGTEAEAHDAGRIIQRSNSVTPIEFFTGQKWIPQLGLFGVLPLVTATLMTSIAAMIVALPIGIAIAIYLSEYASTHVRSILKPTLEVLAGIPTVVYGYFALTFMTPILRSIFGNNTVEIYNTASAGIVIGILIIPLVSSMTEDALSAVPRALREGAYALGATKLETAIKVVVPAAISGIAAAMILAISRAFGETMIVALAAGAGPNLTFNPFKGAETITGHIVRISGGDLSYDSIDYNSLFALGLLLFFITLILNIISQRIVRAFREVYE
jgi:phosphate transport system permease protein